MDRVSLPAARNISPAPGSPGALPRTATAAVARILQEVRSDPDVVWAAADAARGGSVPKKPGLPRHKVVRDVHVLLDAVIAILQNAPDREQLTAHAEGLAAELAAQGVSLAALLTGVQAARSIVLDGIIMRLRALVTPEDLVAALATLDAEVAPVMTRMVLAHQAAERNLARTSSAARVRALRRLLGTGDRSAAEELGLDLRRRYHVLVADVSTAREASSVDALIRTPDGVSALVNGALCRVTSHLPAAEPGPVLIVASPPAMVEELSTAHGLCCQAAELARQRRHTGLRMVVEYAVDLATRAQPLLARFLTDDLLSGLDPANPFHRQLAETARTYLANGSRLDVTSAALHVHPNTVSHRLRRLGALTGFTHAAEAVSDLAWTTRWWWALDAWLARTRPGT